MLRKAQLLLRNERVTFVFSGLAAVSGLLLVVGRVVLATNNERKGRM